MIAIHHLGVSQSERIIWLMEELGLPYELVAYARDPQTMRAPPELRAIHPLGQAPVIRDGDVTLAESLAIVIYVIERYGGGRLSVRPEAPRYAEYLYWLTYSIGGLMPLAMQHLASARMGGPAEGPMAEMARERRLRHFDMIEARLAANDWLAGGDFTAADIMCHFPFGTMSRFAPFDVSDYPAIRAWVDRIGERPAYRRMLTIAGYDSDPALIGR